MAELLVREAPGAGVDEQGNLTPGSMVYCCPTCSRGYVEIDDKGERVEIPRTCRRCGSPMDLEKGKAFAAKLAEDAAKPEEALKPRTVTR